MKKNLSIIIPAYNEEENIFSTLTEVASHFKKTGYAFEVLVINDGSTDKTVHEVKRAITNFPEIRLIEMPKNSGKGDAIKEGVRHVREPYCLFMDADNSTRIDEWPKFENAFSDGARVVSASRHLKDSDIVHPQPFMRRFLGTGYRRLCRVLFGLSVSDLNCGFKAYETAVAKKVYALASMKDWTFDLEIFCLLKRYEIPVIEVPVRWEHKSKKSNLKPISTAFRSLVSIARIKKKLARLEV